MKTPLRFLRLLVLFVALPALALSAAAAPDPASVVPATAPRTLVLAGRADAFRAYCLTGPGAKPFAKLRADLDARYLALPFPAEPVTYGDPSPSKRDSDKADRWRDVQDVCGVVSGVAEAATLCWLVTGEEKYLAKAKSFLLAACAWHFAPDWKSGPVLGATDILYNDEGHFRLWRKLPEIYDQLRARLTADEKKLVLDHFRERGRRSAAWIEKQGDISHVRRNSADSDLSSHPIRFMPMTGLAGLALWDDLPEARDWWAFAYKFYRDQFSPWGGDDGGWAEGSAYWRGTIEHAAFQDTLLSIGDPLAYASPLWKNSPLFCLYHVQPYRITTFGDAANAGHFNLEPGTADYFDHLARVQQNGYFRSYAALVTDPRPSPIHKGLAGLDRGYPTAAEFLLRNFIARDLPLPAARPLAELPAQKFFRDVGWVSLHSALGRPADDIHVTFKSSPYGSLSHSHADQNAFILNAYGESLAINSAYREFHNSPHHDQWTRQTKSKNLLLLDGVGQLPKSKKSTGTITRYEEHPRYVWTTGDATVAYAAAQMDKKNVQRVTRDLVFIDARYVVLRDRVVLGIPAKLSWLLHAEKNLTWDATRATATILGPENKATLTAVIVAPATEWRTSVTTQFPVRVDPKYAKAAAGDPYVTGTWHDQAHLTAESATAAKEFTVYTILWPERGTKPAAAPTTLAPDGTLMIARPDGKTDRVLLTDGALTLR
ncbi:MAG: hypothetical protein RLZZ15_1774 [Verrucomicrobiota bacterium]|jgi:hypothetical protein